MDEQGWKTSGDDTAGLLTRYGELAAELEETEDPARAVLLRRRLAELDDVIDALSSRAHQPEH
ncbi:hypothetical protein CDG81_01425 [Actinopolyspora erythraea]|uniref:Uncharacterized protein n=2 Tax=Actinopolyspora erythraea TaxID=414996 RepID=A0A099DCH0_9ACTN|nr:hypothetical protein [Actinopolyspora erythraea]ASU80738.1 hypothetical protein CDG81_01425 [Actinopolyspora erythraea]KGI83110.1 hypothetical protein IL38_00250 [Actinopolyspora erythraea]